MFLLWLMLFLCILQIINAVLARQIWQRQQQILEREQAITQKLAIMRGDPYA
jgi:uncharacterized membrane protein YidH (DUF202 family)